MKQSKKKKLKKAKASKPLTRLVLPPNRRHKSKKDYKRKKMKVKDIDDSM
jgi:hypothetical protein